MMLPRLLPTTLASPSSLYLTRNTRLWSSLTGSRYVCKPVDDKENASVISDLLIFEKTRHLKSNWKTRETETSDVKVTASTVKQKRSNSVRGKANDVEVSVDQKRKTDLLKGVTFMYSCYITGQDAANMLVKHLKKDLREGDVIAEAHLGMGVLTKTLLEQTNHKVIGYEPNTEFLMNLRSELSNYSTRLELRCIDLFKFYWYYTLNKKEPEREEEANKLLQMMLGLPIRGEQKVSPVKIVASMADMSCLHKLALSFTFQCCFYKEIFPVLYFYVPDSVYKHLTNPSHNTISRRVKLPFIYYFNIKHLGTSPISNFHSQQFRKKKFQKIGSEVFHLLKITPNGNVHDIVPKEQLSSFHYFMRCMNNARSEVSLISHMEKWIPGCGIDYIKNGFRMFTHPRKIPPDQLVEAYNLFKSLPSYEDCMFHQFCNNWSQQFGLRDIPDKEDSAHLLDKEIENLVDDAIDDEDEEFVDIKHYRPWPDKSS